MRVYKPLEFFMYSHDQDLAGWIVKDILFNKHLRLIGQETTSSGVFIGPLFYYLQIPFYLMAKMSPLGPLLLPVILSAFAMFSFYFVFWKIFNKRVGLLACLFYSLSVLIVFTDREIAPTMPVMLWTAWYLYGLHLIYKGNSKAFILLGLLLGLIWHINLALIIISPLILVSIIFSKKKINLKSLLLGILIFLFFTSPLIIFEFRHNFLQTKSLVSSLISQKDYVTGTSVGLAKLDRVLQLVYRNTTSLFWDSVFSVKGNLTILFLSLSLIFLFHKKRIGSCFLALFGLWTILYIAFFSINSLNPSEYYFNGMNIVWIGTASLFVDFVLGQKNFLRFLGYIFTLLFISLNVFGFFKKPVDASGYVERSSLVSFINEDAKSMNYPCISISYITSPGRNLGYRYLFWLRSMHVNLPISGSPVYTIVFPHSKVDRIDKSFGALGLVLPDYHRYNDEGVKKSCSGQNSNLTDPMSGYTE